MKRIAFISILLSMLCFGCGENNMENNSTKFNDPLQSLEGTWWKLVGIVDAKTCSLKELDPEDRKEKCYTITFDTNSTFLTFSPANDLGGGYIADYETYSFQVTCFGGTKVGEMGDAKLYTDLFWDRLIQSFSCTEKELRLYYLNTNKNSYMLFKPF